MANERQDVIFVIRPDANRMTMVLNALNTGCQPRPFIPGFVRDIVRR